MRLNNIELQIDLSEPSTWRGIIMLATSAGITAAPESIEVLIALGMFVNGLVGLQKDK